LKIVRYSGFGSGSEIIIADSYPTKSSGSDRILFYIQDDEVGDGTTSVTVLASELIREAEKLIDMRIHPQTIIAGWRKATQVKKTSDWDPNPLCSDPALCSFGSGSGVEQDPNALGSGLRKETESTPCFFFFFSCP